VNVSFKPETLENFLFLKLLNGGAIEFLLDFILREPSG